MRGLRKFFGIYVREVEGEGFDTKLSGGWRRVFCELGGEGFANKVMLRGGDGVFASLMIAF